MSFSEQMKSIIQVLKLLIFLSLRQAGKCGRILGVSKVKCLGSVPKARETAKAIAKTLQ